MIDNHFAVSDRHIDRRIDRLESLLIEIKDALKTSQPHEQHGQTAFGDFHWLCEACCGIPASTLRIKSAAGEIPGTKKVGKRVLYEKVEVLNWLRSQAQQTKLSPAKLSQNAETQFADQLGKKNGEAKSTRQTKSEKAA